MSTVGRQKHRIAALKLAALALSSLLYPAAASSIEPNAMRFDRLSMADGLSQSAVMAVAQDKTGFMWFATESGLDRYDGYAFKNYRRERGNPNSLAGDFVRDLDIAEDGSLWAATDGGGVSRWDPQSDSFNNFRHDPGNPASLATDRVRTILTDPRGYVWIGTRDAGLDRLNVDTGAVTHFRHVADDPASLSSDDIYALAVDRNGQVWVGTKAGLNRLDPATGTVKRYLRDGWIGSLHIDRQGTLWVGTRRKGLCRLDLETESIRHHLHDDDDPQSISSNRVEVIFEDDRQRLWIGTDNGLNLLDARDGTFTTYRHDPTDVNSLSGDYIFSIFQDRGGVLWIGTRTGGLSKWNPRTWSFGHFKPVAGGDGGFSNPNVTSFTESGDGRLWVGTFGGGLNVMDPGGDSITQLRHDPADATSLSDDRVMALLTDRHGRIWAGTMTGGLNRIDPDSISSRVYRHAPDDPASLAADGVMSLLEDSRGRIWVGTFGGGVSRLDDEAGVFTNFPPDAADGNTLSSPRATAIAEGPNGILWVGTDGGGLNWRTSGGDVWHQLRHNPDDPGSLSADTVYALHVDSTGALWVGTRAGLDRLVGTPDDPGGLRLQNISARHGLAANAVYGIQADDAGNLWLSTNRGLTRFHPQDGEVQNFHVSQGLQGEEFNFGASYASPTGRLFFGGSNGFNAFRPSDLEFNDNSPAVVLTSLSVLNEPVPSDRPYELIDGIELGYSDDVVTFGISALDYAAPAGNRYAYWLEGFDDGWVEAGAERRITYTNLDGGLYTLHVKAANSDGAWNEAGISIPLSVAYPPWKTWWAYTLYAFLFATAVVALWRRQEQKLKREAEYSRRLEHEVHSRTKLLNDRNKQLKAVNTKLIEASTTDPLTGLRNRRYLYEQIAKDVDLVLRHYRDGTETIRPGGNNDLLFLMVDLDNFKPVNDNCGHEAGDELLIQIRDVLLDACRFSDDVIRWGGDEFLVVARETNRKFAANLAERIRSSLSQRVFSVGNGQVARITTSIGYASYPFIKDRPDLLTWEDVLGVADAAMYEAKQKRNAWIGIEGVAWDDTGDALYQAIKSDPGTLADQGAIRAIESLEDTAENYA